MTAAEADAFALDMFTGLGLRLTDLLEEFATGGETGCPSYAEGERDGEEASACVAVELDNAGAVASISDPVLWDTLGTCTDTMVHQHEGCGDYAMGLTASVLSGFRDML
jgi:hypothetical protein